MIATTLPSTGMTARSKVVVSCDDRGRSTTSALVAEAPLLLRVTDRTAGEGVTVQLVGGAAGPLTGDRLSLDIDVCAGARLTMRSVAASLAQPGRVGAGRSVSTVTATVAPGASLDWWPEPLISVAGSDHLQVTRLQLADDTASARWVDELVLGRHEQPSGILTVDQRITGAGRPLLQHTLTFDPRHVGIGLHGHHRVVITAFQSGPQALAAHSLVDAGVRAVRVPLSATGTAWTVLADDLEFARATLAALGCCR
jgi:urease accessory protein